MAVMTVGSDAEQGFQHTGPRCLPPPSRPGAQGLMEDELQPEREPAGLRGLTLC